MSDIEDSILGMNRSEKSVPRVGSYPPSAETAFKAFMAFDPAVRTWRNAFTNKYGESPTLDDPTFDYREAYAAGNKPHAVEHDDIPHWDSRGKSQDHATEWMNDYAKLFSGADPHDAATPDQVGMVSDNASRQMLDAMMQRLLYNK